MLNYFKYSMEKAFEYMEKEIDIILNISEYSNDERSRLFYACGTCLHWVLDVAERIVFSNEDRFSSHLKYGKEKPVFCPSFRIMSIWRV